ncbi:glutathione transferase Ure2p class [Trametes coccinea BRFM310]|uniref:glutathione transferase n=1 Tax=Trametes coccinea (strain BRFM310) TaxID=1353009 RepID=A0A1Y2J6S6_TRAC3|nr:glutathione transferase Ure2p class [Trametes coccinea BRFM310]
MSDSKPLTLYGSIAAINPIKVGIVLQELGLEYDVVPTNIQKGEHKQPEFLKLNPNGRVPALVDHSNGDFTIWESDAIIMYIVDKYDKERKLSFGDTSDDKYTLLQWLFFQASGQGPYFGQAFWFMLYHPERIPSAVERYQKEILRVIGVLDGVLAKQEWLVGGKLTVADLSFVPWNVVAVENIVKGLADVDLEKQFPAFYKWHQKLIARPVVAKLLEEQAEAFRQSQALPK